MWGSLRLTLITHSCGILLLTQARPKTPCIYTSVSPHDANCMHKQVEVLVLSRAGTNGTADTAIAVPVFEGEKMASLGF